MANLQKSTFQNADDRLQRFVDKFFHLNHAMQEFRHEEGLFMPDSMVMQVNGDEVEAFEISEPNRAVEALTWIRDIMNGGKKDTVILVGTFTDNGRIRHAPFTKFVKTEEFGGEGPNKVNAGNKFEEEFFWSMQCKLDCLCKPNKYEKEVDELLKEIKDKELKRDVSLANVVWAGPANKRRTIVAGSPVAAVSSEGRVIEEVGSTLTDVTAYFGGEKQNPVYVSCKAGSTVTWINTGTGPLWDQTDFASFKGSNTKQGPGKFKKKFGADFLDMFGLDQKLVAKTFNDFPRSTKMPTVSPPATGPGSYNLNAIKGFLRYCVGYGYWMVHKQDNGNVDMYWMNQAKMNRVCAITGGITIQYGGVRGEGKRINILCSSSLYNFTFNIRGKQRLAIYPTHVMCDYKKR